MTYCKEGIDAVTLGFRKGLTHLAWIEIPNPHICKAGIRCRKHKMGKEDGGICLGSIHAVAFTHPGLFIAAANDKHHRGAVAGVNGVETGQGFLALDNPDAGGLVVPGRWSQAPCFKDHLKLNINGKGMIANNRYAPGVVGSAIAMDPTKAVTSDYSIYQDYFGGFVQNYTTASYDGAANWKYTNKGTGNPVAALEQTNDRATSKTLMGNFEADYFIDP